MKMIDPFRRVERKNEAEYRLFRESMEAAGVKTARDLAQAGRRMRGKFWVALSAAAALNLFCVLLLPSFASIVAVLSGVFVVWLSVTALRVWGFVYQYRREIRAGRWE